MDPNELVRLILDEKTDSEDVVGYCQDLIDWLDAGGFEPRIFGKPSFGGNTAARLWCREWAVEQMNGAIND